MPTCPWCEKAVIELIEHPLPDDDYIEICIPCSLEDQSKKEDRFVTPRLKPPERDYARV